MPLAQKRPLIAVLLPPAELDPIAAELARAGFDPVPLEDVDGLESLLAARPDLATAILDADSDLGEAATAWDLLHRDGRSVPALVIIDPDLIDRLDLTGPGHEDDEYLARPYSAESIRWRIEAMCIRSLAVDDGSGPVLQGAIETGDWGSRGQLITVFNPKGGVGKTMIATNLAATIVARGKRVLLVDADTVTGHVPISLGMDAVPTVVDHWRDELEGGPALTFTEMASAHSSGLRVLPLTANPIHTELLDPDRVANAIAAARRGIDYLIVDLHPSYSPLNRVLFDKADRILVPLTPDLPAIHAAVQLRDVADELGMRDRISLIVNRFNSGIRVDDVESAVGIPVYAQLRSAGPIILRATNVGRTLVEIAPREAITNDFAVLADRIMGIEPRVEPAKSFRLFGRPIAARA